MFHALAYHCRHVSRWKVSSLLLCSVVFFLLGGGIGPRIHEAPREHRYCIIVLLGSSSNLSSR